MRDSCKRASAPIIVAPAGEWLIRPQTVASPWPEQIRNDQTLASQARMRRDLYAGLNFLFRNTSASRAIDLETVEDERIADVYIKLADFLEADPFNSRLILYLPFGLLPSYDMQPRSDHLAHALKRFMRVYIEKWKELLNYDDLRANFVDGDIIEPGLSPNPMPRVRKAAHLIPQLVEKKIISLPDVIALMEKSGDTTLAESIADALPVVADLFLLPRAQWKRMFLSSHPVMQASSLETIHGLEYGYRLDAQERDRLFDLLNPASYGTISADRIYVSLERVLKAASQMIIRRLVSEQDMLRISATLIATMRFWSMNYAAIEITLDLADIVPEYSIGKAICDYKTFAQECAGTYAQEWTGRWHPRLIDNEIMTVSQTWERVCTAQISRENSGVCPHENIYSSRWLENLSVRAIQELRTIERHHVMNKGTRIPEARNDWERMDRTDALVTACADQLACALIYGSFVPDDIRRFVASGGQIHARIAIRGIGSAVEMRGEESMAKAKAMHRIYKSFLYDLWHTGNAEIRDALESLWSRWIHARIIRKNHIRQFGISLPKLDPLFPSRNMFAIKAEINDLAPIIASLRSDSEIRNFLYPVILLFGSRVKGYASRRSDLDIAVFVKPEVLIEDRPRIQSMIRTLLGGKKARGKALEFWLMHDGDKLVIRDFPDPDNALGDSTLADTLFGGIWYGDNTSIKDLYRKLLPRYVYSKGDVTCGQDSRNIWLHEMERDALLYRLMHRGYARHYAPQGGINTRHADRIDGNTAFWDSGYRRVATKLFVARVFLPQLE